MILFPGKKPKTSQQGIALIFALLVLLLISAVLMGMVMMSNTETNVSANFRDEQTAFFAARAGLEEVRDRLRTGAPKLICTRSATFRRTPEASTWALITRVRSLTCLIISIGKIRCSPKPIRGSPI